MKHIKVACQFGDMNISAAVSKNGWYGKDTFADLVVRSSGIDTNFLSNRSEREQQPAMAARKNGQIIFMFSSAHRMFFHNKEGSS